MLLQDTPTDNAISTTKPVVPTDSGYGSAAIPQRSSTSLTGIDEIVCFSGEDVESAQHVPADEMNAPTEYSAATTTAAQEKLMYLGELSADIYSRVHQDVPVCDWPVLCKTLPDLVKAFAVKLGTENSPVSRKIMRFIHKYHR